MTKKLSVQKRANLIRDLIHAEVDLTRLHHKYGLSPDSLARWIQVENNHRCLTGLCMLADLQTQLLLSRYRLIAAGKLIDLATQAPDDSKSAMETSRRACVDLLKMELPRAEIDKTSPERVGSGDSADGLTELARLLGGGATPDREDEDADGEG